jgi:DNA-directed RNA polymerase specialized sigma24 family protein
LKRVAMSLVLRTLAQANRSTNSDHELLACFAESGDQAAIVARHTNLVLGVCRRTVSNQQDAEDACQAAFLLLAKKANCLRWQESVANWL